MLLLGVIKGSEDTLAGGDGRPLDFPAYQAMSSRNYSTFLGQREAIFSLFDAYVKRKKLLGDMDSADR